MFRNEANKEVLKAVNANVPDSLKKSADFIAQTIGSKNKLLTDEYLSRPDENTLKQLFIIRSIN